MRIDLHGHTHYVLTHPNGETQWADRVSHILADVGIGPKFGRNAKEAAELGSALHALVKRFFETGGEPGFLDEGPLLNSWLLFKRWWDEETLEPLDVERRVGSARLAYAGTLDLRARNTLTGLVEIVDFKTSKPLTSKPSKACYKLQLAAYGLALDEMGEGLPARARVIRVGKECSEPEVTTAWETWDEASDLLEAWERTVLLASWMRLQREAA